MKRESKLLLDKASDSLLLAIEVFNRPQDRGRISGVLIFTDHAFEMLLKAAIVQRGGKIREKGAKETIGFDACVRRGLSDGGVKFLSEEQALTIQSINGLRDAAQHHLLDISEHQLYIHIQSGLTLFRDLLKTVFGRDLAHEFPARILPISVMPLTDIATLFDSEVKEILKLIQPGKRRSIEAEAKLRPLAVLDSTIRGEKGQPSTNDLNRIGVQLRKMNWTDVFVGVAGIEVVAADSGVRLSVRLTKKEGPPIHIVPEGTPGAATVAVKRVNELDFYNLGARQLAKRVGLTEPKLGAVVAHLSLQGDEDCFKAIVIGSQQHKRYSQKAIERVRYCIENDDIDEIWAKRKVCIKKPRNRH